MESWNLQKINNNVIRLLYGIPLFLIGLKLSYYKATLEVVIDLIKILAERRKKDMMKDWNFELIYFCSHFIKYWFISQLTWHWTELHKKISLC